MSGSLSLSLSQRFDRNGKPLAGGRLYFYVANTTTPQNAYQDAALTLVHPNPITLDAYGNIPEFYLADGNIHFRLTDSSGVRVLEAQNALVIGPSGGGGGGGSAVDPTAIAQTGDTNWQPVSIARPGWVRMNNKTLGNASSSGSERASADTQALYIFLYTNFPDSIAGVTGGRSGNALNDFNAAKAIRIPDLRGRIPCGLDDMGNTPANNLSGVPFSFGNNVTAGSYGGEATHVLVNTELPIITPTWTPTATYTPGTLNIGNGTFYRNLTPQSGQFSTGGPYNAPDPTQAITPTVAVPSFVPAGNVSSFGGNNAHNNMPLIMLGTYYIKL